MRTSTLAAAIGRAALSSALFASAAASQAPRRSATGPVLTQPPVLLRATTLSGTANGDDISHRISLNRQDGYTASMADHGNVSATLYAVTLQGANVTLAPAGYAYGASWIWMSGTLTAGRYHVHFAFASNLPPSNDKLTLRNGQHPGDPALASCTVTNPVCDMMLDWTGGHFDFVVTLDSGVFLTFGEIDFTPNHS